MYKAPNPFTLWTNAVQLAFLTAEAQAVISMRVMGMAGFWSVTSRENHTMVAEKVQALTKSAQAATGVSMRGGSPEEMMAAAIKPFRQKTRANTRRLVKRGPKRS